MTDASSSVADTLTGAEIRNHKFSNAFRGLDPEEVRRFLSRLADVQDNLREAVKVALQERDELAEQVAGAADEGGQSEVTPVESAEDPVALAIREEASSTASATLSAARNEANAIVAKANDEAARIVLRARAESRGRALEGSQSDPVFGDVPNDPDAAKEQARMMIQEARAVRERILTDLAKRRKTAHIQLEQLRVAREKLLESLREARRVVDEASRDLSTAEVEARMAAEAAGRRVAAEPLPSSADLAAEIAGISNVYGIRRSIEASNSAEAKASEAEEIAVEVEVEVEVERDAATVAEPAAVVEEPVVEAVVHEPVVEEPVVEAVSVEVADGEPIVEEDLEPAAEVAEIANVENDAVLGERVSEAEHNVVEPQHLVVEPEHVVVEPEHAVAQVESEPALSEPALSEPGESVEPELAEPSSSVEVAVSSAAEIVAEGVVAEDVDSDEVQVNEVHAVEVQADEVHDVTEPESVVDDSVVDESVVDEPTVDEPTVDEPTADETGLGESDVEDVAVESAVQVLEARAEEPTTDQPTTDEPTTELPGPADDIESFEGAPTDESSLNEPVAPPAVAEPVAATPTSDSGATDKPKRRVGVDDLFARLRAEREQAAANARVVLDDAARSARETNESAAAARKAKADAGAGRSEPTMDETFVLSSQLGNQASEESAGAPHDVAGSFDDLANDDAFLESTDDHGSFEEVTDDVDLEAQESYVTGQLQSQLVRSAKRHLGDEQSSALAVFRTSRGRADLLMLLGDEPQQLASLQATLSPFFEDAFRVGSHQAAMPDDEVQAAVESFVAETVHDIVGRIRSEIGEAAEATASPESDASLLNDAISNAYRSWTTDEVAGVANGRLVASWRVGQTYRANRR